MSKRGLKRIQAKKRQMDESNVSFLRRRRPEMLSTLIAWTGKRNPSLSYEEREAWINYLGPREILQRYLEEKGIYERTEMILASTLVIRRMFLYSDRRNEGKKEGKMR